MDIVWLPTAQADRTNAIDYIARENPSAALDQLDEIEQQSDMLAEYPKIGRVGRRRGTRELAVNRTPFILVYWVRLRLKRTEILRLLHGAQNWPWSILETSEDRPGSRHSAPARRSGR